MIKNTCGKTRPVSDPYEIAAKSYYWLTRSSGNSKTGRMAVTTASERNCPPACPLKKSGCYAEHGKLGMMWQRISRGEGPTWNTKRLAQTFTEHIDSIAKLPSGTRLRLHQAGDLPGHNDLLDPQKCLDLATVAGAHQSWTYTHYPPTTGNQKTIRTMAARGVTVNLSANNTTHALELSLFSLPTTAIVPTDFRSQTISGRRFVVCPAQTGSITCSTCGGAKGALCSRPNRPYVVAFRAHGTAKAKASRA